MKRRRTKRIIGVTLSLLMVISLTTPLSASSSRVNDLLANMTLRQKITQMLMVDFRYWDEDVTDNVDKVGFTKMNSQVQKIVEDYDFGAVIYFAQNLIGTEQSFQLSKDLQAAATKDNGIPLMISADQEGGSVYRLGTGTALPGNMALGAAGNVEYSKKAGEIIGSELSVLGINTNLAPVVDVNNNANNPVIGLRSYSDDAETVGNLASATIDGLKTHNVIGCAKHFPGHGDTATDSHYGLPVVDKSKEELMENELKPYKVAIEQGIEMIMTAHILYPQLDNSTVHSNKTGQEESRPATMSKNILTDLLKEEMGFNGVVVTDAMNMAGVANTFDQVQAVILAFEAGVDMVCMPTVLYDLEDLKDLDAIIDGVEKAVNDGELPESRLNDAVTRILTLKENRGILDYNPDNYTVEKAKAVVGSKENRDAEREIAAAATTVIKNKDNTLPLNITENSKVLMLCPYDNEKSQMIMAWNRAKEAGLIPSGAEVKVQRFANADLNAVKENIDWADTVIINSEISTSSRYASHWLYKGPEAFVNYCAQNNKTSVIMSVDKPYDVQMYENADAILAVYGCKGSSVDVTEALTGGVTTSEAAYGPNIIAGIEVALGTFGARGKLPIAIPKYDGSTKSYSNEIVYPRGYGIIYDSKLIDRTALNDAIKKAAALDENKYTTESWSVLANALSSARAVAEAYNVSQDRINEAAKILNDAIKQLVITITPDPVPPVENPDKTVNPEQNSTDKAVATGDQSNLATYSGIVFISLIAFLLLKNKKENI